MDAYIHYRTKNKYQIVETAEPPLLENPETKEWTEAVIYKEHSHLDPETGNYVLVENPRVFVRSKESFTQSFSLCQL